ncbi:MAG TPA: hypothetical protein VGH20_00545 [Myxococcales bacterium]
MRARLGVAAAVVLGAIWACGGGSGSGDVGAGNDAGTTADSGTATDAGSCPFGAPCPSPPPDAGTDAGTGQTADAGTDGGVSIVVPNAQGWTFLTASDGLSSTEVMGAGVDEGGNLWVAGGTGGVFVMRKGAKTLQQFGLADGLHPYGYMPDGGPADLNPHLEAISVSGGPSGTAFIGYMGKTPPGGNPYECEGNWDGPNPDPAIYKSGDADKVTLQGAGISVVHYDIFSGPDVVKDELRGREKLCHIRRILYDHTANPDGTHSVWFGGNHGFAWGKAEFAGDPTCNGEYQGDPDFHPGNCAGVFEHVHPAVDGPSGGTLTQDYFGMAFDSQPTPDGTHDVWFGGYNRTTLFKYGTLHEDYFNAQTATENDPSNIIDVWKDTIPNTQVTLQPNDDNVSSIVALPNGHVLIGSFDHGIRELDHAGNFVRDVPGLPVPHVFAMARDPEDGSIWVGYGGAGVSQILADGTVKNYAGAVFGDALTNMEVHDIQIDTVNTATADPNVKHNRVIISFKGGVVGIHQN